MYVTRCCTRSICSSTRAPDSRKRDSLHVLRHARIHERRPRSAHEFEGKDTNRAPSLTQSSMPHNDDALACASSVHARETKGTRSYPYRDRYLCAKVLENVRPNRGEEAYRPLNAYILLSADLEVIVFHHLFHRRIPNRALENSIGRFERQDESI